VKLPLNPDAVKAADQALHDNHPELGGRPLTMNPEDEDLREEWMDSYVDGGGELEQAKDVAGEAAAPAASCPSERLPKGGTYVLRDPETGRVMRSGRTNDLARREREHARSPELRDLEFEVVHRTDDYAEQRGLEQMLHEAYEPPRNRIRGIDPRNPKLPVYREAAEAFLKNQKGET
jgi:hypothetical protein